MHTAAMTDAQQREMLEAYRPWLRKTAFSLLNPGNYRMVEDLMQEGWIDIWRESRKNQDPPWLMACARNRMRRILQHNHYDKRDDRKVDWYADVTDVWDGELIYENIELAYHYGAIAAAIDNLSPKQQEYVRLRFWLEYDYEGLTKHFGYNPGMLWSRARRSLDEELGYLRQEA